jgi:hypothetical protein
VTGAIVSHLVRAGLLPPDREVATRAEIGDAIAAAFDPARRAIGAMGRVAFLC